MTDTGRPKPFQAAVVQHATKNIMGIERPAREEMAANRDSLIRWVRFLMEETAEPPKLVVFPTLSMVGASRRPSKLEPGETSLDLTDPFLDPLVETCARYDCYVATSTVEVHPAFPGHRFHTGFVLGPNGLVVRQPKVQARSSVGITVLKAFRQGYADVLGEKAVHSVVETPIGRLGVIVESEQLYPEVLRGLARNGADIVIHPNLEFPVADRPFSAVKQARAFENSIYLVSANAASESWREGGEVKLYRSLGNSMIVGPQGHVLARCDGNKETFAVATIDLAHLDEVRAKQAADTQPDWAVYSSIYAG